MLLKKLSISGFKSFADKVTLNFDAGITGIVGPNGCGKSNVIDSVRWVMGEQNAKNLRGETSTDIIFSGSEKRKPLGLAEVALTFDNSEDKGFCPPEYRHEPEITISRRIYSDGSRDYFINRKQCRLKDVTDFFATTGLGGRSYSMIQQGQVDRILNAKPEDVREILEEAAGTLVYKKRKQEAQKRLESAQGNLSRMEDIMVEIVRQKDALYEQVEKAKKWQELSQNLRQTEVHLLKQNFSHFNFEKEKLESELASEQEQELASEKNIANLEEREAELKAILDTHAPKLHHLREEISHCREEIARKETQLLNLLAKVESEQKFLAQIDEHLQEANENRSRYALEFEEVESKKLRLEGEYNGYKTSLAQKQEELDEIDESFQVYLNRKTEIETQQRSLDRLIDQNHIRNENLAKEIKKVHDERAEYEERKELLKADVDEARIWYGEAREKVAAEKAGLEIELEKKHNLERTIASVLEQKNSLDQEVSQAKEKSYQLLAQKESLQAQLSNQQDFLTTYNALVDSSGLKQSELVKLDDLITINDPDAILSTKGLKAFDLWSNKFIFSSPEKFNAVTSKIPPEAGSFEAIIESEIRDIISDDAKKYLQYQNIIPFNRFIHWLRENATLQKSIDHLFYFDGNHLDPALFANIPKGVEIITASGYIASAHGTFRYTGGRVLQGKIATSFALEAVLHELSHLQENLNKTVEIKAQLDAKILLNQESIAAIDKILDSQNRQVLELLGDLQSCEQTLSFKEQQLTESQNLAIKCEQKSAEYIQEIDDLEHALLSLQQEKSSLDEELSDLVSRYEDMEERRIDIIQQIKAVELKLASMEATMMGMEENYHRVQRQFQEAENKIVRWSKDKISAANNISNADQDRVNLQSAMEELIYKRETMDSELLGSQDSHSTVIEELKVIDRNLREIRDHKQRSQRIFSEKKLAFERVRIALDGVILQALENYHLDLNHEQIEPEPEFDQAAQVRKINRLKASIEGMGLINMMALSEYENLVTREQFLSDQRDEVVASIDLLRDAIAEIEETSLKRFMETFYAVNLEFAELFPILFPSGEAQLTLTDEANPLESGIEIMVRLPGKKHQRLNLFSGGEKALTAISLIFALLKTKPTPFCFLDEVDAPLDEANVGRYNRVLEALSSRFQFVIITHNRRTMEILDTLYGVTMQEPGVSKVVGVDMRKDLPDHLKKQTSPEVEALPALAAKQTRAIEGATAGSNVAF